jgi:hypothetical protein
MEATSPSPLNSLSPSSISFSLSLSLSLSCVGHNPSWKKERVKKGFFLFLHPAVGAGYNDRRRSA